MHGLRKKNHLNVFFFQADMNDDLMGIGIDSDEDSDEDSMDDISDSEIAPSYVHHQPIMHLK